MVDFLFFFFFFVSYCCGVTMSSVCVAVPSQSASAVFKENVQSHHAAARANRRCVAL